MSGNRFTCSCGHRQLLPDVDIIGSAENLAIIAKGLDESHAPLVKELADELQRCDSAEDLEKVRSNKKFQMFKDWLPITPQNITGWDTATKLVLRPLLFGLAALLTACKCEISINDILYAANMVQDSAFRVHIDDELDGNDRSTSSQPKRSINRKSLCPCKSGRRYKNCCGRH
jgi:hypothetical protein